MTRWLSKLFDRLFVKLLAVAFTRLEVGLDLVLVDTQRELLEEAARTEREGGAAVAPAVKQLRVAAERLAQVAGAPDEQAAMTLLSASGSEPPKAPPKPKAAAPSNGTRGRGRPKKVAVPALPHEQNGHATSTVSE